MGLVHAWLVPYLEDVRCSPRVSARGVAGHLGPRCRLVDQEDSVTCHPHEPLTIRLLSAVAALSGVYDVGVGLTLLAGRDLLGRLFAVPPPVPPIHADLNALFLLVIGVGYLLPVRRPQAYRGYLWVMGPVLKGLGALVFLVDHLTRHSHRVSAVCGERRHTGPVDVVGPDGDPGSRPATTR